jgi:uncharacterized membrane protein
MVGKLMKSKSVKQLSDLEKDAVEGAIFDAEKFTSAEFFAVLAQRSDDYRFFAYGFFAFWIFLVSSLFAFFIEWQMGASWENPSIIEMIPLSYIHNQGFSEYCRVDCPATHCT